MMERVDERSPLSVAIRSPATAGAAMRWCEPRSKAKRPELPRGIPYVQRALIADSENPAAVGKRDDVGVAATEIGADVHANPGSEIHIDLSG